MRREVAIIPLNAHFSAAGARGGRRPLVQRVHHEDPAGILEKLQARAHQLGALVEVRVPARTLPERVHVGQHLRGVARAGPPQLPVAPEQRADLAHAAARQLLADALPIDARGHERIDHAGLGLVGIGAADGVEHRVSVRAEVAQALDVVQQALLVHHRLNLPAPPAEAVDEHRRGEERQLQEHPERQQPLDCNI